MNNALIEPFFIDGNLNAAKYKMLRNEIFPAIRRIVGDNLAHTWFQQDGAGLHYSRDVRNFLDTKFPNRWIGRRGEIEWLLRSPDLSPFDYFLWDYLKVYATKPRNLEELRQRIIEEIALIDLEFITPYSVFMIE